MLPERHVVAAITAFRVGDLGDGRFVPKAAEIRRDVQRRMELERAAAAEVRARNERVETRLRLKRRKPPTPEEKDRANARVKGLRQVIAMSEAGDRAKDIPDRENG